MTVSGVLSLETELSGHGVSLFRVKEGTELELLLGPLDSESDGTYMFNVPLNGSLAIQSGEVLITMSRDSTQTDALWSYLKADGVAKTSNLNVLASVASEIGVWEEDVKGVFGANDRTADVFGLTGDARSLELLDPKNEMLMRLGKIVSLLAVETTASTGAVHKAIAKDILDGSVDAKASETSVSLIAEQLYAAVVVQLKAVIAGSDPDLAAIRAQIPVL